MYKKKLIDPVFSVALNRPEEGAGALALGGLPGPHIKYENKFAKAPMEQLMIQGAKTSSSQKDFSLYAVKALGFDVDGRSVGNATRVIIDSGTTMSYLPAAVVNAMGAAFNPPAKSLLGNLMVNCNARAPKFGIKFNGATMYIDGKDLILSQELSSGGRCALGIQGPKGLGGATGGKFSILGGPFMKSVVSVFDVGAAEIRFANRKR
jgi:aspergillopepsin I